MECLSLVDRKAINGNVLPKLVKLQMHSIHVFGYRLVSLYNEITRHGMLVAGWWKCNNSILHMQIVIQSSLIWFLVNILQTSFIWTFGFWKHVTNQFYLELSCGWIWGIWIRYVLCITFCECLCSQFNFDFKQFYISAGSQSFLIWAGEFGVFL